MDEIISTETSPSSNQEVPNDESHLWQYVTKVEKSPGIVYMRSYSRVKAHLLQISGKGIKACLKVTKSHSLEMQRMHDQVENNKLEREQRSQIPLPHLPQAVG